MEKFLRTINADVEVCEQEAQFFEERTVTLPSAAVDLLEPQVRVTFDQVVPLRDKIIVQGRIFKNLIFKEAPHGGAGFVRHIEEVIPFAVDVDCPGFRPGSVHRGRRFCPSIQGNDFKFFVDELFVFQALLDEFTVLQKIVLRFKVKVLREEQLNIWTKRDQVFHCPSKCDCC